MPRRPTPRYMGGQAVVDGVMMRGSSTWAVAVRKPEGDIEVVVNDAANWAEKWSQWPLARGIATLAESLSLGFKALMWSAEQQLPEDEREKMGKGATSATIGIAVLMFAGLFLVLPALAARGLNNALSIGSSFWLHVAEGVIRLGFFIAYLVLIGRLADIRRVFQYHGAEHKAIAAYENDVEVTPESAQRFSTEHVRCGTNFLLTVMVVSIVVFSFFGRPSLPLLIASRIVLIPVVAAVAYEVIRFAAGHMRWAWVRIAMKPGLGLQRLTTREPTLQQLEVAIASLRAVMTSEQRAEVDARVAA
ncbi:MAG: DUF1385 domain-containing protein [Actinomycetota bacterium]